MPTDTAGLSASAVPWCEEAAEVFAPLSRQFYTVSDLEADIKAGAVLFRVLLDGEPIGFYALKVDGVVGVILACAVRPVNGVDMTAALLAVIERQFVGCDELRAHTVRAGLVRKLVQGHGWEPEFVLRKKL